MCECIYIYTHTHTHTQQACSSQAGTQRTGKREPCTQWVCSSWAHSRWSGSSPAHTQLACSPRAGTRRTGRGWASSSQPGSLWSSWRGTCCRGAGWCGVKGGGDCRLLPWRPLYPGCGCPGPTVGPSWLFTRVSPASSFLGHTVLGWAPQE